MSDKFYVTTPIYYVNDIPHIGHAYTTIAADILARWNRLLGKEVFFLTGTDEHGQKVEKAAAERRRSPKEHADRMVENFKGLWKILDISNDAFIRTTDGEHIKTVQGLMQMLWDRGEIEKRTYAGWYCTPDERFWTEKELVGGNCPDCGRPVEEIHEDNYFFLMSKYQERLITLLENNPFYILPETRRNEVLGFLRNNKLGDLCISRPKQRLSWGIPLPFDEGFVTYVWFDALVNYFSATRYLSPGSDKTTPPASPPCQGEERGGWWPASHHLVGKDILTTHAVYWSTMLMALDLPLPKNIFAHGWWTVEGKKMSKSLGNVVDPQAMVDKYGVDAFRYFLFREVPFGLDGDFSEEALVNRINTDLANDLGNLLSRSLTMIEKFNGGEVPLPMNSKDRESAEERFFEKRIQGRFAETAVRAFSDFLRQLRFSEALGYLWAIIHDLNKYIDYSAPWREDDKEVILNTLYTLAEALSLVAVNVYPFMPSTAGKIWKQLGIKTDITKMNALPEWGEITVSGNKTSKGDQLFPRIEKKEEKVQKQKEKDQVSEQGVIGLIGIEDFARVELKIGKVIGAERVEKSNKLIRLRVDTGEERQIVAGIGKSYSPEDLVGKKIVVVANLKPAKLMGVESQGMLLAATDEDGTCSILTPERDVNQGSRVK